MIKHSIDIPVKMQDIINNHVVFLTGAGAVGGLVGPGSDLIAIAPSWATMTIALAKEAGQAMSEQTAKKIALAATTGAGIFICGTKVAATVFAWLSAPFTFGASLLANMAVNAGLNASFTRAYGRACARLFIQTSEIDDGEFIVKMIMSMMSFDLGITLPDSNLLT